MGLPYISPYSRDLRDQDETVPQALTTVPYEKLFPGSAELAKLQQRFR